jgi:hypothetical protein
MFFSLLRSFYTLPSIQTFSKQFPKLPNKQSTKQSSLSQSIFNEPTTHHLINTHDPKDSIKQRKRIVIVDLSLWLSKHPPLFFLPDTQASSCNPAFHWSDPWSSQTIIIVSLNLQRIQYTSSHQIPPSSKRQHQAKKEDLHRWPVVMTFYASPSIPSTWYTSKLLWPCISLIGSPKFLNHHHCLPQPSKNPLHIILSNLTIIMGAAFGFLTQVLFSKQSPALQISAIVQHS